MEVVLCPDPTLSGLGMKLEWRNGIWHVYNGRTLSLYDFSVVSYQVKKDPRVRANLCYTVTWDSSKPYNRTCNIFIVCSSHCPCSFWLHILGHPVYNQNWTVGTIKASIFTLPVRVVLRCSTHFQGEWYPENMFIPHSDTKKQPVVEPSSWWHFQSPKVSGIHGEHAFCIHSRCGLVIKRIESLLPFKPKIR